MSLNQMVYFHKTLFYFSVHIVILTYFLIKSYFIGYLAFI